MTYTVKEMFLTARGEGAYIGRSAVFNRFAGCNPWSGREADRASAICRFGFAAEARSEPCQDR